MLVTLAGRRQIVTITGNRAIGVSVDDGALLWSYPWATDNAINIAQPIVLGPSRLFLSSGYGKGAAAIELTADGDRLRGPEGVDGAGRFAPPPPALLLHSRARRDHPPPLTGGSWSHFHPELDGRGRSIWLAPLARQTPRLTRP
jgi:hypothetical protein